MSNELKILFTILKREISRVEGDNTPLKRNLWPPKGCRREKDGFD